MGCGSSMDTNSVNEDPLNNLKLQDPIQIVQDFMRLDEEISKLEATCAGPSMATAEAWVEHLQAKRNEFLGIDGLDNTTANFNSNQMNGIDIELPTIQRVASLENDIQVLTLHDNETHLPNTSTSGINGFLPIDNGMKNVFFGGRVTGGGDGVTLNNAQFRNDLVANTPNKDLASLALNLGVVGDVNKASTHEDFFASLSESALYLITLRYYNDILEHARVRLKTLIERYAELNELYLHQDGIIAFISGGTYMSRLEESIDSQLEVARDVRDKLGSTMEQWRITGILLNASATSATTSLLKWQQIANITNPKDKVQAALDCRNTLQASLISLDCAQLALPHVAIRYISQRQILAVRHCNVYMITDIANLSRYEHTSKVFTTYESNMSKASKWLYDTFNNTLRRDFEKAEEAVRNLAKNLRDHREEIFTAARR